MACRTLWRAGLVCLGISLGACEDDMESMLDASADAGEQEGGAEDGGQEPADAGQEPLDAADADAAPATRAVELSFAARVGTAPFDCTQTYGEVGSSKITISMSDFRLYVSDVYLIDAADQEVPLVLTSDGSFQSEQVALLDFEDRSGTCLNGTTETNTVIRGTLPAGSYKGVRFSVGVPSEPNHADPLQQDPPLDLSALFWSWQAGHKFMRVDARVETASGNRPSFLIHLGSDGCAGNPGAGEAVSCARSNRASIELSNFDPDSDQIVLDYAQLVADVALDDDQGGESGCMSGVTDPECQSIFGKLGLDAQSGSPGSAAQSVFSVEPK